MHVMEADYIIAGGGSAGCVLAARLSEDPNTTVLLLEAGGPSDSFLGKMPTGAFTMLGKPKGDWVYMSEADPSLDGRQTVWSAGKMLGGGSAINGMIYIRGAREDYDAWEAAGCTGWGWKDVLPYFKKSENFAEQPSPSHGKQGPLGVAWPRMRHSLAATFVKACTQIGLRAVDDYCAGDIDGAFENYVTQKDGQRSSAAYAFLQPAMNRPNLTVITDALVDRIVVEDQRAVGVAYRHSGQDLVVRAAKEVVISASTMGSPAILLRSGIGPADELQALGIDVVVDAPQVGKNLQEHASVQTSYKVDIPTYNVMLKPLSLLRNMLSYLLFKRGVMTLVPVEAMAFFRSDPTLTQPDIKLQFGAIAFDPVKRKPHDHAGVVVFANVAKPKSRGEIRLKSRNPEDKPVIDHRLLGADEDVTALIRGMKKVDEIFNAPALAAHLRGRIFPEQAPTNDAQWERMIRTSAGIGYHPVGTCAMGGTGSVVDSELRVRGIRGLRVADASVMPIMPAANTNAPSIMIGEKAADLIRQS